MLAIFFLFDVPPQKNSDWSMKRKLLQLDPLGNFFLIPCVICLLLALEWGGSSYAWSNWRIIFLFVLSGVLCAVFVVIENRLQEKALVPPRIFKQRSVLAGIAWTMCTSASMMVMLYYLPIWFQAIKNVDAEKSGIMNLPLVLSMVIMAISSGVLVSALGYYNPFMILAVILMSIGSGMLTLFEPDTSHPKWIGYQIIFGFGLGLGAQQANVAVQTCLTPADVPIGASLLMFSQQLNGAVFIAIAEALFSNFLKENLSKVSGVNAAEVIAAGATALRNSVSASKLSLVLDAYSDAIIKTFVLGVAMSCLAIFPALAMEWKSVKGAKKKTESTQDEKAVKEIESKV